MYLDEVSSGENHTGGSGDFDTENGSGTEMKEIKIQHIYVHESKYGPVLYHYHVSQKSGKWKSGDKYKGVKKSLKSLNECPQQTINAMLEVAKERGYCVRLLSGETCVNGELDGGFEVQEKVGS